MNRSMLEQLDSAAGISDTRQVLMIAVDAIEPDPDQPRKTFVGLRELAASIRAIGIKQPLLVRPHGNGHGRYVLVAGERRLRSARRAGLASVPCLLEAEDARQADQLVITQLSENLQRADAPILETAQAIQRALSVGSLSKQQLAAAIGKPASFVSKHLALLKAEGVAREALEEGFMRSTETFRLFNALPAARQRLLLAQARRDQQPIARSQVTSQRPKPSAVGLEKAAMKAEVGFTLELSGEQIRTIIRRFAVEPPRERSKLKPTLLSLLQ